MRYVYKVIISVTLLLSLIIFASGDRNATTGLGNYSTYDYYDKVERKCNGSINCYLINGGTFYTIVHQDGTVENVILFEEEFTKSNFRGSPGDSSLYFCFGDRRIKECSGGLSGGLGSRCYQNIEKNSWFNCQGGWKLI